MSYSPEDPARLSAVQRLYNEGLMYKEIAAELGIGTTSVERCLRVLREQGRIGVRAPSSLAINKSSEREKRKQQAVELYDQGHTFKEIAEALSIGDTTVGNYLQEAGVTGGRFRAGKRNWAPVKAIDKMLQGLDDQAAALADALDRLEPDHTVAPDMLAEWDEILTRRGNITAVLQRVRRFVKERT